ncbi:hypothetical protein SARC_00876 [Sphaeroforma arctica JP610]|uniref:Uncharacterized protein n=1 Tax=Sphaeroforma arctica JP610 TaxID=667725 RepID=A0A0L0GFD0_9EUKA|nr:hypothetical protein SARC_00876 [Sphaeroforma arctica JP610]KNC86983.1 hypothetical protein SARC_00876 [Sphaeroforma arctica JP610]|eukprot:XP_014160885.1 hypothetical protein SARC_00876 [Sphaeroforma arctica JP610]
MPYAGNEALGAAAFVQIPPHWAREYEEDEECTRQCETHRVQMGLSSVVVDPLTPRLIITEDEEAALYCTLDRSPIL